MGDDAGLRLLVQDAWDRLTPEVAFFLTSFTNPSTLRRLDLYLAALVSAILRDEPANRTDPVIERASTVSPELLLPAFEAGDQEALKQRVLDLLFPTPDASSQRSSPDAALDSLRRAFDREYEDPGGLIVSYVLGYVDECFQKWARDKNAWYSPCSPIVQSSGWGKSRVVKQLASAPNPVVVFYFSLLKPTSAGYPRSNPDLRDFFVKMSKPGHAYTVFWACFDWLAELEVLDTAALFQKHQDSDYSGILERISAQRECTLERMQQACIKVWSKFSSSLRKPGVQFLFVVDEARELFSHAAENAFTVFRRACGGLPVRDAAGSFVLFIDTTARAGDFTPVSREDPSFKVREKGLKTFGPLSRLPTFNLSEKAKPSNLDEAALPGNLFAHGRPLWAAQLESKGEGADMQTATHRLVNLAKVKLLGGLEVDSEAGNQKLQSRDMSLVFLGRLIGVDVCPQSMVAQELVASHMRICLHTSETRDYVLTMALPEPVLAEAAAKVVRSKNLVLKQLEQLNSLLLNGIASAGERGELVARFLLLNAMHSLQGNNDFPTPQSLENFLKAFCSNWGGFTSEHLKEAKVFFNAFYRFFSADPSVEDLKTFVRKCGAMICSRGQKAYDLYIPFVFPNPQKMYDLSDDNCIGCLGIQVRNRKDVYGSKSTLDNMKSYQKKLVQTGKAAPNVVMLLHLGGEKTSATMMGDETALILHFDDINCQDEFIGVLQTMLCESPDPITILKAEEAVERETNALKSIVSDVYPKDAISKDQGTSESNVPGMGGGGNEDAGSRGKRPIDPSEDIVKSRDPARGRRRKCKR